MNALDELEEIKELVNSDKKFKYKNIVNFNIDVIKDELEYANNCHNLEEQIGCPLEVREKALIKDFIWYDDNSRLIQVIPMNSGYIMEKGKKIAVLNCIYNFNFWLAIKCKDYKKTWWLKEDKE